MQTGRRSGLTDATGNNGLGEPPLTEQAGAAALIDRRNHFVSPNPSRDTRTENFIAPS